MLIISVDSTPFHHNIARGNNTFGLAFVDQQLAEFGPPGMPVLVAPARARAAAREFRLDELLPHGFSF